ncbi:DUF4381 domain-containing protein [Pontiellaceae bacterium B12227]|nr:DUF4381 domain-containing protein [Pontiellaceae bacterium B12227]
MNIFLAEPQRSRSRRTEIFLCVLCGSARITSAENLTLNDLNDIVMPDPVSGWPPAPGVWILQALMLGLVAFFLIRKMSAYRKNAYRRAALTELAQVDSVSGIAEILRRVAIHAYGRETVALLKGEDWFQWLEVQGGFQGSEKVRQALASVYSDEAGDTSALRQFAEQWIREHTC